MTTFWLLVVGAILTFVHFQVSWLPIFATLPAILIVGFITSLGRVLYKGGQSVSDLSQQELAEKIVEHANVFLPNGLDPFVDIFRRLHHRRELRRLIDGSIEKYIRKDAKQLIEMLFYGNSRMKRKVAKIYGISEWGK